MVQTARVVPFDRALTGADSPIGPRGWEPSRDLTGEGTSFIRREAEASGHPAAGRTVPLQNLGTEAIRLARPLYVVLEESDGRTVAISYDLEVVEDGDGEFEAIDNLRSAIVELYNVLRAESELSPSLQAKLTFLESLRT